MMIVNPVTHLVIVSIFIVMSFISFCSCIFSFASKIFNASRPCCDQGLPIGIYWRYSLSLSADAVDNHLWASSAFITSFLIWYVIFFISLSSIYLLTPNAWHEPRPHIPLPK